MTNEELAGVIVDLMHDLGDRLPEHEKMMDVMAAMTSLATKNKHQRRYQDPELICFAMSWLARSRNQYQHLRETFTTLPSARYACTNHESKLRTNAIT